ILADGEAEPEAHAGGIFDRPEVIRHHQLYRLVAQVAPPVEFAAAPQHLQKSAIVGRGRQQARATGIGYARTVEIMSLTEMAAARPRIRIRRATQAALLAFVDDREPVGFLTRQIEGGV